MNKFLAGAAAFGLAGAASAQEWQFELSNPVLSAAAPSTTVMLSIDPGPADYAVAGVNFNVHASEPGWSDPESLFERGVVWDPLPSSGEIIGASVIGIWSGQLPPQLGFIPKTGRVDMWRAMFTLTDFTARHIDLSTETTRLEVYTVDPATLPIPEIRPVTAIEGAASIRVVPAPTGLALLGLGWLAAARRQRPAAPGRCTRSL